MKKILLFVLLLVLSNSLFGNPVGPIQAMISEFKFDPINKWELEIGFGSSMLGSPYLHSEYDSICVTTSAGTARIRMDFVKDSTSLLVITPDSLSIPLSVNSSGDCITLYSYLSGPFGQHMFSTDPLSFGNYPGAMCDSMPTGYSICRFYFYRNPEIRATVFCLARNPTIGAPNDTSGCCATMTGIMFDNNNKKITSGSFMLDYSITFNTDGTYSTRVLARKCVISSIFQTPSTGGLYWLETDTVDIDAYPDSVVKKDIHLIDVVGIKEKSVPPNSDLYIINYPNPFNPGTNFYVRIPTSLERKNGRIVIYNSIGQKVFVIPISNSSSYNWNGVNMSGKVVSSGVYYYRLIFNDTIYKTGSMILLK